MEGEELSSHFRPPLNSAQSFFTPQNHCFFIPPYQNPNTNTITTITNPPPPTFVHRNLVVESIQALMRENLNFSSVEQKKKKQKKKKQKKKKRSNENPKATWYKGPWTKAEDRKLCRLVLHYGRGQWASVAAHMNGRIGKQCRERYHNNLFPNIKKSAEWSDEEEMMIMEGHKKFGNRWSAIAKFLAGRSENAVKNHWNSIKRRWLKIKSTNKINPRHQSQRLNQSSVLEDYIKEKLFDSAAVDVSPPPFTITAAARSPIVCGYETLAAVFSASAFLRPPFSYTVGGNSGALIPSFSAAATFAPPPIVGSYNNMIPAFSTTAATFSPPFTTITGNGNVLMKAYCSTAAAATTYTPPIMTVGESYDALIATSFPTTFTPPPPATENATFSPPPFPTTTENSSLIETDPPLSVDDYDTDGIPYFTFESAINESSELTPPHLTSENAIDEDLDLMLQYFTSESAIDENLGPMQNMQYDNFVNNNFTGNGGIHPPPFADSAALTPHFASETAVDEEMGFLSSLFGSYGELF